MLLTEYQNLIFIKCFRITIIDSWKKYILVNILDKFVFQFGSKCNNNLIKVTFNNIAYTY